MMKIDRMPDYYLPPYSTPLYWKNEQSGDLVEAVMAFFGGFCGPDQLRLVIDYCRYVIDAPCWEGPGIEPLRSEVRGLHTVAEVRLWIGKCLNEGVDPL